MVRRRRWVPGYPGKWERPALAGPSRSSYSYPDCLSISLSIYQGVQDWNIARQRWANALTDLTHKIIPGVDASGNPNLRLPSVQDVVSVDNAAADAMNAQIELDYLAMQYRSFGCWNDNSWDSAPAFGAGGGGIELNCHSETWEVSSDGGQTWSPIEVQVCEYNMM